MELISHHQPEEFGKGQKETPHARPLPRIPLASIHLGWVIRAPPGKTELEWLAKDYLETNPITIKPKTSSHEAEQFSWVPLPSCSPPGCHFPIKYLALSACVFSDNSFPSVRQEPSFGPWKRPFLQQFDIWFFCLFKIQLEHLEVHVHVLLKPDLENFEHYFASVWDSPLH